MRNQYAHAVSALEIPQRDNERATELEDSFMTIVSFRTKLAVYLVAVVFYYLNFVFLLGFSAAVEFLLGFSTAVEIEGIHRVLVLTSSPR
ncbi:hypothetical protein [Halovenus marina]|uniref:hypothetical protein n=1 Tax=Halovenus marina TaxID=3396621 RepID=UPI003F5659AD